IDRVGARRVSISCDVASVLVVGAIPLLYALDLLPFSLFLVFVALAGALRGPGDGAKQALVPTLAAQADVPLERVTGLHSTVERTAGMLGAAFAGGLVALIGPTNALVVDAASFGVSALVLAWATTSLVTEQVPTGSTLDAVETPPVVELVETPVVVELVETPATAQGGDRSSYLLQLREGWDYLRGDRVIFAIAVMVALTNLLDIAWATVQVPVWAQDSGGGAGAIGLLFAVFGGASALGAMCAATWAARLPRYRTYLLAFLICGAPRFVIMAIDSPLWAVLAVAVASGFASGFINPVLGAVIYERIPEHLMGRVTSLTTAMCFALMPFGGLLGGLLISGFGLAPSLLVCGAAYFVVTMVPAVDPRWREMDRRPEPTSGRVPEHAA
ncbi:MAG: putative efflux transporter protein, partial [Nocardioides sp.]|nr:putative efflux transporter protein [Nocardioides sp.]